MSKNYFLDFEAALKRAADKLSSIEKNETIRVVSNLDADGITAASIIIKVLQRLNLSYAVTILHQLKDENGEEYSREDYKHYIFCDLGSGQLNIINKYLKKKEIIILDHHDIQGEPEKNIIHVNPHEFGFDGSTEISAAGVCFFFGRTVNKKNNDLAHLAVIGAIGDVQEKKGFKGLNKQILEIAVKEKKIVVSKGPNLFGLQTRPLVKLIEYGSDVFIPGITNNRKETVKFLKEVGMSKSVSQWSTYNDLKEKDKKILLDGIISKRKESEIEDSKDIFTNVYTLENNIGQFRDAREFSTLLNSCGRMEQAEVGIGVCLDDNSQKKNALKVLQSYRRNIVKAITWFKKEYSDPNSTCILKGKNYVIINAEDKILATMIGTLASIVSKGNELDEGLYVLSIARNGDNTTKASLRFTSNNADIDLRSIVSELIEKVGGEAGGHHQAAGAIISTDKEDEFISEAKKIFDEN